MSPTVKEDWKHLIADALSQTGMIPVTFSGKLVITMESGGVRFMEICQTVK
jgi:hypothetical protein